MQNIAKNRRSFEFFFFQCPCFNDWYGYEYYEICDAHKRKKISCHEWNTG